MSKERQFVDAASAGNIEQLEALWATPELQQAMLQADYYSAFRLAAEYGQVLIIEKLWGWANPTQQQAMLQASSYRYDNYGDHYYAFREAAANGHDQILEKLWVWAATYGLQQEMLRVGRYIAFYEAAANGHDQILEKLRGWAATYGLQQEMLRVGRYTAFYGAAANGHDQILEKLMGWATPLQQQEMLQAENYAAFHEAATRLYKGEVDGSLVIDRRQALEKLWGWAATYGLQQEMLQVNDYMTLRSARERDGTRDLLWGWATHEQQQAAQQIQDSSAFRGAAYSGCKGSLEAIWRRTNPKQRQAMLKSNDYEAFRLAANGYFHVILWNWCSEQTKMNVLQADFDKVVLQILTSVADTGYNKLMIDIFAHMSPELRGRAKKVLFLKLGTKLLGIKLFIQLDGLVDNKRNAYEHMWQNLQGASIVDSLMNDHYQVFQVLKQTASIEKVRLYEHIRNDRATLPKIALLRLLWPEGITDEQILEVANIFNTRNQNARTRGIIKHIGNHIGLSWGNGSPPALNSPDITKVLYNLGENQGWIRRWVSPQQAVQIFTTVIGKVFQLIPVKDSKLLLVTEIAIDQFIGRIKRYKWPNPEHTKDAEIPAENKEQVKQALIKELTALAKESQPVRQKEQEGRAPKENTISVARAVCEQLFPLQSRTIEEHIFATTLQVRLQTLSYQLQKLAGNPAVLKQFTNILEEKLEKAQVDTKTEDKVIDDIIQAAMREALTRKAPLAPTAISRSGAGQTPATWKEREESKRRPSGVLASVPGIGLGC